MDDHRFDALSKSIATRTTRRTVLKGAMAAVGAAAASFMRLGSSAEPLPKVTICHHTHSETNPLVLITVSENSVSLQAHLAHGDFIVDLANDPNNCGACGFECPSLSEECTDRACIEGECVIVPAAEGTPCDDGNLCTSGETCNADGECVPAAIFVCPSDNPCIINNCNPDSGVCEPTNAPAGTPCDDGNVCTDDRCDGQGTCVGAPIDCDDGIACTDDVCDLAVGCVHIPNDDLCVSDDPCFVGRCVADRGCVFTQIPGCGVGDTCGPAGEVCNQDAGEFCCVNRECCTADQYCGGNLGCCDDGPGPCQVG